MTMNRTLFLLNVLALVVLTGFHFHSSPATADQGLDVAGTYIKPHLPLPQRAVMTGSSHVTPHLATERSTAPVASENTQSDHWVF